MKKLFPIILLCLSVSLVKAQTYTQSIDSLMFHLDKSQISSGILYDRVFPFAALSVFNNLGVGDTSSFSHFKQAYSELYRAAYNNSGMLNLDVVKKRVNDQAATGIVPIGLINYHFNFIDTLAIDHHLIDTIGGKTLYDVAGRTASPYIDAYSSVIAALADSLNYSNVGFQYSSSFLLSNTNSGISSFTADFGDGSGVHTLSAGQTININYSTTGVKIITYQISYTNGQSVTTYSALKITSLTSNFSTYSTTGCNGAPEVNTLTANIPYQGYGDPFPIKGEAVITTMYHTSDCDHVLKEPIILINGFDPGSVTDVATLIKEHLIYGVNRDKYFVNDMLAKGFDIIFFTYLPYTVNGVAIDGGADYIQRNAFTLIKLIDSINTIKANNGKQLVVVGPSMGGLISRYALAYMEQHNMDHNTRLWVSFDSPNLGANIPIGDQWLLHYLAFTLHNDAAADKYNINIASNAAREMLLHFSNLDNVRPTPDDYRNSFVQELNTLGYPTKLRKVAVINGSTTGALTNQFE